MVVCELVIFVLCVAASLVLWMLLILKILVVSGIGVVVRLVVEAAAFEFGLSACALPVFRFTFRVVCWM